MIREGFVEQNEIPEELRCCRKSLVTGYVKFCYVPMVTVACRSYRRSCVNVKRAGAGLQKLGKTPLGRYLFTSSTLTGTLLR